MRPIDADELRDIYSSVPNDVYTTGHIITAIDECETVDAVPVVHGRWEYSENIYDESTWVCSICKEPWTLIDGTPKENGMKYCPFCGAKMDGEADGTDK